MIKTQILEVKDFQNLKNPNGKLRKKILDFLKLDYTIYLDFTDVNEINLEFSKESLCLLKEIYDKTFLKEHIKLVNVNKKILREIEKLNDLASI